ncbi:MAG: hypothetical protein IKS87_02830 [Lachnospiraceae bacterium]|nr:hypothetical protein [Lachnospiraceae bacterium]
MMKRLPSKILFTLIFAVLLLAFAHPVHAAPLDEILDYEINATVNENATVTLTYHIEWKVLDSTSEGPLSWVKVGIPNSHYSDVTGLTDNIKSIKYSSSGGSYLRIDFDREYVADEVVTFEFSVVQDYLYQVDKLEDGFTVYSFTPGWFDDITVDKMTVRWSADHAVSWTPDCYEIVNSLVWINHDIAPGEKLTFSVTYPNDAYQFDLSKKIEKGNSDENDWIYGLFGLFFFFGGPIAFIYAIFKALSKAVYLRNAAFGAAGQKQIKRTKIVYYDSCPGCGAARGEGQQNCAYCGKSLIKSEEVIEEKDIRGSEKEAAKFSQEGEFKYTDSPNTFIRVHVVPVPRPTRSYSSSSSGSSHHSCAHSSCACACACACAGGGRAGCSTKDFYRTNLRLRYLFKKN